MANFHLPRARGKRPTSSPDTSTSVSISEVTWNVHIDTVIQKVARLHYVMIKLKYKIDRKTLENMYISFVRPKLEYGSIIWDDCTEEDKLRLESIQLMFGRIVTGAKRGTSHDLLYMDLGWQKLSERRNISKLKIFHKLSHGNLPQYLSHLLPLRVDQTTAYNLRNNSVRKAKLTNCKLVLSFRSQFFHSLLQ